MLSTELRRIAGGVVPFAAAGEICRRSHAREVVKIADYRADGPSEIHIGDSLVLVSGPRPDGAEIHAWLYLYDPDADAAYTRALAHGAVAIEAPGDTHYGDRRATIKDPCGNTWQIATRKGISRPVNSHSGGGKARR